MRFRDRPADLRRLRPRRSLFWQASAAALAFLAPVSGALYYLTIPDGPWLLVLALQVLLIATFFASYLSYISLGFWVGPSGIAERGFFGLSKYVPREQIGSIVLVNTYRPGGTETRAQLFICDNAGMQLLRMRGQFWSMAPMLAVSDALDIPLTELTDDVTRAELLEEHPGLLYWFERHPVIIGIVGVAALAAAAIVGALLYSTADVN
ncbi:hypothetical protein BH11ACT2_BH11ACT2_03200 [soil metagenome]